MIVAVALLALAQTPSSFLASASAFIDSVCLPSLCNFSPSSRKAFTLDNYAAGNFEVGIFASIARISPGQPCAEAVVTKNITSEPIRICFMEVSKS